MGRAPSSDLRSRVYGVIAEGGSRRAAARRFGVSAAAAVRLAQRQAQTGSLAPARQGRPAGSGKLSAFRDIVIGWVEADGELTLPELADRLAAQHAVAVHPTSLSRLLKAAGFTVKKTLLASETDRADIARAWRVWHVHRPWMKRRPERYCQGNGAVPISDELLPRLALNPGKTITNPGTSRTSSHDGQLCKLRADCGT